MALIYIGLGSNLGDRRSNCEDALKRLEEKGVRVLRRSSPIETEPWGLTDQPLFMNMAVEAETDLPPEGLLGLLMKVEEAMGRKRTIKWGPRIIDLDILFYDDLCVTTEELTIPHPLLHERDFVLRPLAEIAPEKIHPVFKKTMAELLEELGTGTAS